MARGQFVICPTSENLNILHVEYNLDRIRLRRLLEGYVNLTHRHLVRDQ